MLSTLLDELPHGSELYLAIFYLENSWQPRMNIKVTMAVFQILTSATMAAVATKQCGMFDHSTKAKIRDSSQTMAYNRGFQHSKLYHSFISHHFRHWRTPGVDLWFPMVFHTQKNLDEWILSHDVQLQMPPASPNIWHCLATPEPVGPVTIIRGGGKVSGWPHRAQEPTVFQVGV